MNCHILTSEQLDKMYSGDSSKACRFVKAVRWHQHKLPAEFLTLWKYLLGIDLVQI